MKKILSIILAITVVLSLSVSAFAATSESGQAQQDTKINDQVRKDIQSLDGETPADLPAQPEQDSESPRMNSLPNDRPPMENDRPTMENRQAPTSQTTDGEAPADLPAQPEQDSESPRMNSRPNDRPPMGNDRPPMENGPAFDDPQHFVDFEAMVNKGVITQDTLDQIRTYMKEHKPDGRFEPKSDSASNEETAEDTSTESEAKAKASEPKGLLEDLLQEGVITQAQYEAMCEKAAK